MKGFRIENKITVRNNTIDRFFTELNQSGQLISPEEEAELSIKIKQGDKKALDKLVKANLRFVVSVAKQYSGNSPQLLSDLISQGSIGLIEAAHGFDHTTGFKFISYAVWYIRKEMLKFLKENGSAIRLPINKIQDYTKILKIIQKLEQKLQRPPSISEITDEFIKDNPNTDEYIVNLIYQVNQKINPLIYDNDDNDSIPLAPINVIPSDEKPENVFLKSDNSKIIKRLIEVSITKELHKNIIIDYFGLFGKDQLSLTNLGDKYEMSTERIRQIVTKSINLLRYYSKKIALDL